MRTTLLLLLSFSLLSTSHAQTTFTDLDDFLESNKEKLGKDFNVMLWKKDDTVVYRKQTNPQFRSNVQAPVAASSQWLTAALVMMFVDEGKLTLDDPVVNYVPEFGKYFKNYITLRHCLSHTTGIESEALKLSKLFDKSKFENLEKEVNSFAAKNIAANPGKEFYFSNIGISIAGRVLEVVGKRRFDQLMTQKLFRSLAMRRSTFANLMGGPINPSIGGKSSADDYMNFLVMLLNKGKFRGQQVLSEESVAELIKIQTGDLLMKYLPDAGKGMGYASGAWVLEEDGNGNATALISPSLFGFWSVVDFKRGYAFLLLPKEMVENDPISLHKEIIEIINPHFE